MAEKTVNVVINFKVNTAEVQKAQAASQAAQRATDQLRNSTNRYGSESSKAFKQSSDAARAAHKEVASLDSQFNTLYNSVRLFLTAGLAKELIDVTLNMARLSGTVEGVEKAFSRLPNATLLLESLRKATRGTVNDLELMQKALMASNFRIPLEKLGTLLEFAAVKAQQTGQEVNHLVNYIVSGIGYRSIKRLDDLGFTANRVKEALGGVSLQAASMGQVMDAVTKLMQEDLEKTGGFAETAATKVGQIETKYHELRVALAQKFENSGLLQYFQEVLDVSTDLVNAFPTEKFKELFDVWSLNPIVTMGRISDVIAGWQIGLEDVARQRVIDNNAKEEAARIEKRLADLSAKEKIPLLDVEIKKKQAVADQYFYAIQAADMTIDKFSEENIARKLNIKEIEATIKILKELRQAQIDIANAPPEVLEEDDEKLTKKAEKQKEVGEEVRDYLAYLSEQEMFNVRKTLDDRIQARKDATAEEIRIEKEAKEERERLAQEEAEQARQLQMVTAALAEDLLRSTVEYLTTHRTDEVANLRDYYDEQIELAGDNERRKKELRIKADREIEEVQKREKEREKKAASTRILIDGLVAIGKIFRDFGWPGGIVPAAIMAGITATNVATVRKYAKGKINIDGPGTETSDSIPSMLSRGESVITAQATRRSIGLLEAIQANKIDDRILKNIDFSGGKTVTATMNDERIVKELKSIRKSQYRIEEQAGLLYRVYEDDDGNKRKIRSKSI